MDDFYEITRDLAECDPLFEDVEGVVECCLCSGVEHLEPADYAMVVDGVVTGWTADETQQWVFRHSEDCPWLRAKELFDE